MITHGLSTVYQPKHSQAVTRGILANLINVIVINLTLVEVDIVVQVFTSFFIDLSCKHTILHSEG